eukprot:gene1501-2896_t
MSEFNKIDKIRGLLQIRKNITNTLRQYDEELEHVKNVRKVKFADVIKYADYTSRTIRAPPHWQPGHPVVGGHPPAPQAEQMRLGKLGELNGQFQFQKKDIKELPIVTINDHPITTDTVDIHEDTSVPIHILNNSHMNRSKDTNMTRKHPVTSNSDTQPQQKKTRLINLNFFESESDSEKE